MPTTAPTRSSAHRAVLLVTCLALATVVSAVASLNVAIPSIAGTPTPARPSCPG